MNYKHYRVNQNYTFSISDRKENARRDITIFENGKAKENYEHYDHTGKIADVKRNIFEYIKNKYLDKKKNNSLIR